MTTRPGTWQRVHTDAGHHLRLMGANGEPVVYGEPLTDPRSVITALSAVFRAAYATIGVTAEAADYLAEAIAVRALVDVDERASTTESASTETES